MLKKIVHRTHDCVGIIAGFQDIDGPLQVKYWGVRTPVTPSALTPMCARRFLDCIRIEQCPRHIGNILSTDVFT